MEQRKVLWIIAAVGVFLLVVLGAALVLYTPTNDQSVAAVDGGAATGGWISLAPSDGLDEESHFPIYDETSIDTQAPSPGPTTQMPSAEGAPYEQPGFSQSYAPSLGSTNNQLSANPNTTFTPANRFTSNPNTTFSPTSQFSSNPSTSYTPANQFTSNPSTTYTPANQFTANPTTNVTPSSQQLQYNPTVRVAGAQGAPLTFNLPPNQTPSSVAPSNTLTQTVTPPYITNDGSVTSNGVTMYVDNATIYPNGGAPSKDSAKKGGEGESSSSYSSATIHITTDGSTAQAVYSDEYRTNQKVAKVPPKPPVSKVAPKSEPKKESTTASKPKTTVKKVATAPKQTPKAEVKAKPKAPAKSAPAKKESVKKSEPKPSRYWVQVTSLTSKLRADSAREVLGTNKIDADIFTYTDKNGTLFYRVRVGPYTTKSEAEYWKRQIATIDDKLTVNSYVVSTQG